MVLPSRQIYSQVRLTKLKPYEDMRFSLLVQKPRNCNILKAETS